MSLKARMAIRVVLVLPIAAGLMFGPAGSFRFWQGWAYVGLFAVFNIGFVGYFYRRDPKLIERRLKNREQRPEQKRFKMLWVPLWLCTLLAPGFDYRFGWPASLLGEVPAWLTGVSLALVAAAWAVVFAVLRFNSFASATIQVEAGQKVITDGPYRFVRHPMYTGFAMMIAGTPFALGSYVAVIPALPLIPLLVFRLRDEERVLRQELAGYTEYCERTRFRLIPLVY